MMTLNEKIVKSLHMQRKIVEDHDEEMHEQFVRGYISGRLHDAGASYEDFRRIFNTFYEELKQNEKEN